RFVRTAQRRRPARLCCRRRSVGQGDALPSQRRRGRRPGDLRCRRRGSARLRQAAGLRFLTQPPQSVAEKPQAPGYPQRCWRQGFYPVLRKLMVPDPHGFGRRIAVLVAPVGYWMELVRKPWGVLALGIAL